MTRNAANCCYRSRNRNSFRKWGQVEYAFFPTKPHDIIEKPPKWGQIKGFVEIVKNSVLSYLYDIVIYFTFLKTPIRTSHNRSEVTLQAPFLFSLGAFSCNIISFSGYRAFPTCPHLAKLFRFPQSNQWSSDIARFVPTCPHLIGGFAMVKLFRFPQSNQRK